MDQFRTVNNNKKKSYTLLYSLKTESLAHFIKKCKFFEIISQNRNSGIPNFFYVLSK